MNATNQSTTSSQETSTVDRYERAEQYALHLQEEGYVVENAIGAHNVRFLRGPREYYLTLHEADDGYVRIERELWHAWTSEERQHAAAAARDVNESMKDARIVLDRGTVSVVLETILPSHDAFVRSSWEYMEAIDTAAEAFIHAVRDSLPQPPEEPLPLTQLVRARAYRDCLASLGYDATVDEEGCDVRFTADGKDYWLYPDETWDEDLIVMPAYDIATITDSWERARAQSIIDRITEELYGVNMWIDREGRVYAIAEIRLCDPLDLDDEFVKRFAALRTAIYRFHADMAAPKP